MRIAALVTQPRGGPVDHAIDVACDLAARGHDSHLIGPVDTYADRLSAAGVQWHDVAVRSTKDLAGARELRGLLRSLDADVLHLQDRRAGLVGRLIGRGSANRLVYSVHGVADALSDLVAGNVRAAPRRRTDRLRYLTAERWLDRLTPAQIVVPCRPVGRYAVEHARFPSERVHVVANGIDPTRFAPRPGDAGTGGDTRTTVLWLGVMAPVKRLRVLLHAVASVPGIRLVLAGDGPERAAVEALIDELGLRARVDLRGHVPDPAPVYGEADLFALPSAAEALPLALLQAMSSGLPVVATRVGGIPDVVRPGIDGRLIAPDDTAALADALRELAADAETRRTMGKHARERVLADFTLRGCVDGLLAVYRG
jgi:glycosyltransferase involved in cell wall biosynthesis